MPEAGPVFAAGGRLVGGGQISCCWDLADASDASLVAFSDAGDVGLLQDGLNAMVLLTAGVPTGATKAVQ
ncbi:hypothetical protein DIPPA_08452 [Diplonema papillatum]|nr:hypothetical protein DIPPA_08452 [Diplonema papillatum]